MGSSGAMLGLGRLLKSVGGSADAPPGSTIPRTLAAPRAPSRPVAPVMPALLPPGGTDAGDERGAGRFVPVRTSTVLTTGGGKRIAARIINVSMTGIAVEADMSSVHQDEVTLVGNRPVLPGRKIALGMVFLFRKPLDAKLCNPDIVI